jgi:zinc protease
MVLGNYILGQGFNSRLLSRIRGEEGLSYGIGSTFQAQPTVNGARFVTNAIVAPQNTEQLEASFRDELTSVLRDGYTDEEVEVAKISWAQARQVRRTQDAALASTLLTHARNGRTMTWDVELEAAVQALTREDILEAMQRHLSLDRMTFMKGGDFTGAEASQ